MLARVAAVLQRQSRAPTSVARLGGDEFAIVLPHTDARGRGDASRGTSSTTFARTPLDDVGNRAAFDHGVDRHRVARRRRRARRADELIVEADVAMYDAKEAGRDRICHVAYGEDRPARVRARLTWSQRIREALDFDGFELWEQPILTMTSGARQRSRSSCACAATTASRSRRRPSCYIAEQLRADPGDRPLGRSTAPSQLLAERRAAGTTTHVAVNVSGAHDQRRAT